MAITILLTSLSLSALALAITALVFAIRAYIKIVGLENSTHQIQYVPAPSPEDQQSFRIADERLNEEYADLEYKPPEDEAS